MNSDYNGKKGQKHQQQWKHWCASSWMLNTLMLSGKVIIIHNRQKVAMNAEFTSQIAIPTLLNVLFWARFVTTRKKKMSTKCELLPIIKIILIAPFHRVNGKTWLVVSGTLLIIFHFRFYIDILAMYTHNADWQELPKFYTMFCYIIIVLFRSKNNIQDVPAKCVKGTRSTK